MRALRKRAVSPVIAVVLIIAITASAVGVVWVLINTYTDINASIIVEDVTTVYDYNDDGSIDGMLIMIKSQASTFKVNYVVLVGGSTVYKWHLASDYGKELISGEATPIRIYANSSADQITEGEYAIGLAQDLSDIAYAKVNIGGELTTPSPLKVNVIGGGKGVPGMALTFLRQDGLPSGLSGISTNAQGVATVNPLPSYYKIRTADNQISKYFHSAENRSVTFNSDTGDITIKVIDGSNAPISGITVYITDENRLETGSSGVTNSSGMKTFTLGRGTYFFRVNYLSTDYFSSEISIPLALGSSNLRTIKVGNSDLGGIGLFADTPIGSGKLIRLYTENNVSMNRYDYSNSTSEFQFSGIPSGFYRLRLDYMAGRFWSTVVSTSDPYVEVNFGGGALNIEVTAGGNPLPRGVLTRLYYSSNRSTYSYDYLNSTGWAEYGGRPPGEYRLRIDWLGKYTYTKAFNHSDPTPKTLDIPGGKLNVQVLAGGDPLPGGVLVRLYNANNRSTYRYDYLNSTGWAEFGTILAGDYRLRVDWLGKYTYTMAFTHTDNSPQYIGIGGGRLDVLVTAGGAPLPGGVLVRLYNENNRSTYRYDYLNSTGYAEFGTIISGNYRLRVDWLGKYTYTQAFSHLNNTAKTVTIPGGPLNVKVLVGGAPLPSGVLLRLYNANNRSTYRYDYSNGTGWGEYGVILEGDYRLRVDWLGKYTYTVAFTHTDGSPITVNIPGGYLNVKVTTGGYAIPSGVLVRLYNENNRSTYRYDYTNGSGFAEYGAILSGNYRLRLDWLGKYTYSIAFTHADSSAKTVDYAGGFYNITITIGGKPIHDGVLARLYNSNGRSTYRYDYTNNGNMTLGAILAGDYMIRLDYMAAYTYSNAFTFDGSHLTVDFAGFGYLPIKVTDGSGNDFGTNTLVRLYTSSGSYTGRYAYTNSTSYITLVDILNGTYKLRVGNDYSDAFQTKLGLTANIPGPVTGLQDSNGTSGGVLVRRKS